MTNEARRSIVLLFHGGKGGWVGPKTMSETSFFQDSNKKKTRNLCTSYAFKVRMDPLFFPLGPCLCSVTNTDRS